MRTTMMLAGCGASLSIGASQLMVRYLIANTLQAQQQKDQAGGGQLHS